MKYVLMFATDPGAQADVDPQVAQAVYGRIGTPGRPGRARQAGRL